VEVTASGEPGDRGGGDLTAESGWQGGESPFPAIADYGFLSDCQCNALVAPSGAVEWMCVPRPDSPSVFAAILDRGAGTFRLGPAEVMVPVSRRYLPGTLVLETTWKTRDRVAECAGRAAGRRVASGQPVAGVAPDAG
jgi:hypothetical protein